MGTEEFKKKKICLKASSIEIDEEKGVIVFRSNCNSTNTFPLSLISREKSIIKYDELLVNVQTEIFCDNANEHDDDLILGISLNLIGPRKLLTQLNNYFK